MDTQQLFVYGTLKPGYGNFRRICKGRIDGAKPAWVRGWLYDLPPGYPALVEREPEERFSAPVPERGSPPARATGEKLAPRRVDGWVFGYILSFSDPRILRRIDLLEDYEPGRGASLNEYERVVRPVYGDRGETSGEVWLYVMSHERAMSMGGRWYAASDWVSDVDWLG